MMDGALAAIVFGGQAMLKELTYLIEPSKGMGNSVWTNLTAELILAHIRANFFELPTKFNSLPILVASDQLTKKDWTGNLYCRIVLDWDYTNRTVGISMPGYIKKKLQEYNQVKSKILQTRPYTPAPKRFGSEAQRPLPDDTPPISTRQGCGRKVARGHR